MGAQRVGSNTAQYAPQLSGNDLLCLHVRSSSGLIVGSGWSFQLLKSMHHPRMKIKSSFSFTLGSAETSLYVSKSQLIQKNEYIYI